MTIPLQKHLYLSNQAVQQFVEQLASWLDGESFGEHQFYVRDKILPDNYNRQFHASTLEEAHTRFYWNGRHYDEHQAINQRLRKQLAAAMAGSKEDLVQVVDEILLWASGGKVIKLYSYNRDWAKNNATQLADKISQSLAILRDIEPDCSDFEGYLRMNAGFTKVYSLAAPDLMSYDGRTGAAMGFLVRQYCEKHRILLDPCLCFPWAPGASTMNRNPSTDLLHFKQLANRSRFHAEWKIRATWVVNAAREMAKSSWCKGDDGLRRVEAALFMIGYDIPLARHGSHRSNRPLPNQQISQS